VDVHDGWLIFRLPAAELGIHPSGDPGDASTGAPTGHHEIYLTCDDIEATVTDLTAKGVEFIGTVETQEFGRLVHLRIPGAGVMGLYEPRHTTAYELEG
jgi:predicted enzyme related to lactoylglutathione lyase